MKRVKIKKLFARAASLLMICTIGFLFTGCVGNDSGFANEAEDAYNNGEMSLEEYLQMRQESMSVPLYGTKLLYQPDTFDYEGGTGGTTEGETTKTNSKFFENYSFVMLQYLLGVYGTLHDYSNSREFTDDEIIEKLTDFFPSNDDPNKIFSYDAMRYAITEYNNTTIEETPFVYKSDGETGAWEKDTTNLTYIGEDVISVKADTAQAWNFSLDYDEESLPGYIYESDHFSALYPSHHFVNNDNITDFSSYKKDNSTSEDEYNNWFNTFYTTTNSGRYNTYTSLLLGGITFDPNYDKPVEEIAAKAATDESGNENKESYAPTQYVKALEYAIYCYNLNLVPNALVFSTDIDGNVKIDVEGFLNDEEGTSLDNAVTYIKYAHSKIGSFVGIRESNKPNLVNWILTNVIGEQVVNEYELTQNDVEYALYYKPVKADGTSVAGEKYYTDASGNYLYIYDENNISSYITDAADALNMTRSQKIGTSGPSIKIDRKLEEIVTWVVDRVNETINIGDAVKGDEEGEGAIQGPVLDESYLASEMVDYYGNDFFVSSDDAFANFEPRQYQNMTLMFGKDFEFSNIMLFFEYDAGNDGQGVVDASQELKIDVVMNQYKKSTNTYRRVTVEENGETYDTFPITVKDGPFSYGEKGNTLMLFGLKETQPNGDVTGIQVGEFNTEIGNGIMKTMPAYNGLTSIGTPRQITGNDDLRLYYDLQTDMNETTNKMYTYGSLNPEKFSGEDGCDFFEIDFIVYKTPGDLITNYHFNVGIALVA